jgi:DNA topoisomerase IB
MSPTTPPGITRRSAASGFNYRDPEGNLISDFALNCIKTLAIPPAWKAGNEPHFPMRSLVSFGTSV